MNRVEGNPLCLPWHEVLWSHMRRALTGQRVVHGLLITGVRGVGKRRFAARLAAALLCRNREEGGDACGQCTACRQRLAGTHPDISYLRPEEDGKAIKIEQIRRFAHTLQLTPHHGAGRLGWIEPAEALSTAAANSLLKTLEEPSPGSHLILISSRPSALLPTIRSRCQHWQVPTAPEDVARQWLSVQGVDTALVEPGRLQAPLAVLAQTQSDADTLFREWDKDLLSLLQGRADPVSVAERMSKAEDRQLWIEWLYRRSNSLLTASLVTTEKTDPLEIGLATAATKRGADRLQKWSRLVAELARLASTNVDWRLALESAFIAL